MTFSGLDVLLLLAFGLASALLLAPLETFASWAGWGASRRPRPEATPDAAESAAAEAIRTAGRPGDGHVLHIPIEGEHEELGTGLGAASSSFCFFASGAIVPILPYVFGLTGYPAIFLAAGLVGLALLFTGGVVGVLSGRAPLPRALRQLAIGYGAAGVTFLLGLLFGTAVA